VRSRRLAAAPAMQAQMSAASVRNAGVFLTLAERTRDCRVPAAQMGLRHRPISDGSAPSLDDAVRKMAAAHSIEFCRIKKFDSIVCLPADADRPYRGNPWLAHAWRVTGRIAIGHGSCCADMAVAARDQSGGESFSTGPRAEADRFAGRSQNAFLYRDSSPRARGTFGATTSRMARR